MTPHAALGAIVQLALMLAVIGAYWLLARRFRILWHPLAIVAAVGIVGLTVAVLGQLLSRSGSDGVPAVLRRSAIGSFGWGLVIAAGVWIWRRVYAR
jgi:hypothetical protein